jgi:hypothetical protein
MGCYMDRRGCDMILEVTISPRTWASGICGAHACLPIPLEGIITALYYSRTAIYGVANVAYSI